jgi:hypothetical protein
MSLFSRLGFESAEERRIRIEQKVLAQQEREQAIKEAQKEEEKNKPIFQVGTTEDGRVTLRIGNYSAWVTMTDHGVEQLISMLRVAKGTDEEDTKDEE